MLGHRTYGRNDQIAINFGTLLDALCAFLARTMNIVLDGLSDAPLPASRGTDWSIVEAVSHVTYTQLRYREQSRVAIPFKYATVSKGIIDRNV